MNAERALRIGFGFDIHRLVRANKVITERPNRKLYIGGVAIPPGLPGGGQADWVLEGHSDADVLLHAVTDAVLGALAWGDIGQWFPNTDEQYRDASSSELFRAVWEKAVREGWALGNCDATLLAELPKLSPHYGTMRAAIADLFAAEITQVSVKATTMEKLGSIGRGEGIAAQAVVLLTR